VRDKLLRALGESGTVRRGDALLLAVSGGADSTALLLALHALREELALSLRVLHVHHGLRGEAAERDADFVRALAARYELPFELVRVDVRRAARGAEAELKRRQKEVYGSQAFESESCPAPRAGTFLSGGNVGRGCHRNVHFRGNCDSGPAFALALTCKLPHAVHGVYTGSAGYLDVSRAHHDALPSRLGFYH